MARDVERGLEDVVVLWCCGVVARACQVVECLAHGLSLGSLVFRD